MVSGLPVRNRGTDNTPSNNTGIEALERKLALKQILGKKRDRWMSQKRTTE